MTDKKEDKQKEILQNEVEQLRVELGDYKTKYENLVSCIPPEMIVDDIANELRQVNDDFCDQDLLSDPETREDLKEKLKRIIKQVKLLEGVC